MKCKKIVQVAALAACALPLAVSLGSCTEEDILDNYASVITDSTYFQYDLENILSQMGGTDILHIYTYEVTNGGKKNLKHLAIQKQDNRIYVENPGGISATPNQLRSSFGDSIPDWTLYNLNGDKVTWTHGGNPYTESHFAFGAGVFQTVAMIERTNPRNYTIDETAVYKKLKDPTYDNMKDTWFKYITGAYEGEYYSERQTPWWGWTDLNVYMNKNGEEAPYIRRANGLALGGVSRDTLKIGNHKTIVLNPVVAARNYTFNIEVEKGDDLGDFVITDGYACISGIPERMNFHYQTYDVENTCKTPFRLHMLAADNTSNKVVKYTNTIGIMGVSYGADTLTTTGVNGPGVLQLIIPYKWNGVESHFNVLCNVSKSIKNSGVIQKGDYGWLWGGSDEINIKLTTKITAEMIKRAKNGEIVELKD